MIKLANGSLFLIQPRNVATNDKEVQASETEREATRLFCKNYTAKLTEQHKDTFWAYSGSPKFDQTGELLLMTGDMAKELSTLFNQLTSESKTEVWAQLRPHALNILV